MPHVDLDLHGSPLTKAALDALAEADTAPPAAPWLAGVRAVFPSVHAADLEHVSLEVPSFTPDPRALLDGIEAFVAWLLDARGERRADAPYR